MKQQSVFVVSRELTFEDIRVEVLTEVAGNDGWIDDGWWEFRDLDCVMRREGGLFFAFPRNTAAVSLENNEEDEEHQGVDEVRNRNPAEVIFL